MKEIKKNHVKIYNDPIEINIDPIRIQTKSVYCTAKNATLHPQLRYSHVSSSLQYKKNVHCS